MFNLNHKKCSVLALMTPRQVGRLGPNLFSVQSLQLCLTLCDPMDCSTPGLPVHHQLLEFTQTLIHWVNDAIQRSHPLSSPSPPASNLSQHQGLFKWVNASHQVAKVLEFQLQHQSCQSLTHVHWVSDAIQPSHPLLSHSPPAFNLSHHQGLFKCFSSSNQVAKVLGFSFSISPSKGHLGLITFRMDWLDLLESEGFSRVFSNTTVQKHQFFSLQLSL